ncbi:MAG: N-acetylmuramoyl-L-alanine amidase [Anaerolineales bacterium]|nr:N-acetylmuramoyl-L-alanine amidase [Anaerolineales bacterium]
MAKTPPPSPAPGGLLNAFGEALRHIGIVIAVGVALATVFTAWTPSTLLPNAVAEQIAAVIATSQVSATTTALPVMAATATVPRPKIGLVAGHNGPQNDPGSVCASGVTEAQVNLDIATRVKAGLEANGFAVDLLDEFDPRLEGYQALAVVSIHNDSCDYFGEAATGFKVAGALDTGAPEEATRLVACLTERYAARTGLAFHANTVTADMTQYHTFYEVNAATPIAIIETGFLNMDYKILTEEPQRVAQGVIDGLLCYVLNQPVGQPTPTTAPAP